MTTIAEEANNTDHEGGHHRRLAHQNLTGNAPDEKKIKHQTTSEAPAAPESPPREPVLAPSADSTDPDRLAAFIDYLLDQYPKEPLPFDHFKQYPDEGFEEACNLVAKGRGETAKRMGIAKERSIAGGEPIDALWERYFLRQ